MSYEYLGKAIKHYEKRAKFRPLTGNEREELHQIKSSKRKAEAWDRLEKALNDQIMAFQKDVSGFPYVDDPTEIAIFHYSEILEAMKRDYESEAE